MNSIFSIIRKNALVLAALALWGTGTGVLTSCTDDDDAPENFYASKKMTAAEFIKSDDARFSDFREVLTRSNYLSMLSTYGEYTVFVPDNNAMRTYLMENGYSDLSKLSKGACDTIARTHIVKQTALFTTDYDEGSSPLINMNDRYVEMSVKNDTEHSNALMVMVNKLSRITEKDDSVTNGVVHVIDRVITSSGAYLCGQMEMDESISIFVDALKLTGLDDSLSVYEDHRYKCPENVDNKNALDSINENKGVQVDYGTANDGISAKKQKAVFPDKRYFKFTAFVEKNEVYNAKGIYNVTDLANYAKQIYDEAYPEDAGKYDKYPRDRRNPLNRFVSYHLIDRKGAYSDWVLIHSSFLNGSDGHIVDQADPEDYYETMLPHSIMRFSYNDASKDIYINRKGLKNKVEPGCRGCRVYKPEQSGDVTQEALNGVYHYIDAILVYDNNTRHNVLQRRMRIDSSTLSPDFMNHKGRMYNLGTEFITGYKRGFVKNFKVNNSKTFLGLSSPVPSWWHYEGNGVPITGIYDVSVKLPPVPYDATYEIRIGYSIGPDRGIAQVYLNEQPCGIPVDFTRFPEGLIIKSDDELRNEGGEEAVKAFDKAMRNLDFMKPMDSYGGSNPFRNRGTARRILARRPMKANEDYWLRFRQLINDPKLYMSLDYLEIVPKDVYDSPEGEDTH